MSLADKYYDLTKHKNFYNIMPIENISSVIENGILSFENVKAKNHSSIALNEVQNRRDGVVIPNGLRLHQYANLYFTYNNPMLYKRKDISDSLCVLAISSKVMDLPEVVITDRNAAASLVHFYDPIEGIYKIDFDIVFEKYWQREDYFEYQNHKAIKCAEILVPNCVPYKYILGAYVVDENAKYNLISQGFDKDIVINPTVFYR